MTEKTAIARWIEQFQEERGIVGRTELARELNVNQSLLTKWLDNGVTPGPDNLERMSERAGVRHEVLMRLAGHLRSPEVPDQIGAPIDRIYSTQRERAIEPAVVVTPARMLTLFAEWKLTMAEPRWKAVTIAGDWLAPLIPRGTTILVDPHGAGESGEWCIACRNGDVWSGVVQRVNDDGRFVADNGEVLPLSQMTIVAVIMGEVQYGRERALKRGKRE